MLTCSVIGPEGEQCRLVFGHSSMHVYEPADPVHHPAHYTKGRYEPIDVIEDWQLGFCTGNALKYIARAAHKGTELTDLEKARWYLDRAIANLKAKP
jgi:hypothetical protein